MGELLVLGLVVAALVVFARLALRFGVDSRPGFGDPRARAKGITV